MPRVGGSVITYYPTTGIWVSVLHQHLRPALFDATAAHTADGNRVGSPPLAVVAVAP